MISPGPEDYEELKEQIERAYKLDPKRKELIRDRICELEFQREENKTTINVAIPFIGGILTAYLVVFVAQGKKPWRTIRTSHFYYYFFSINDILDIILGRKKR